MNEQKSPEELIRAAEELERQAQDPSHNQTDRIQMAAVARQCRRKALEIHNGWAPAEPQAPKTDTAVLDPKVVEDVAGALADGEFVIEPVAKLFRRREIKRLELYRYLVQQGRFNEGL